jgi:UDP-glucose 6-dehydrogenase
MTKRIDIVGFGYVGKTIYNSLTKNTNYTLRIVDPKYPETLWKKVFKRKADCAIISIPTPDDDYTDLISIANGYSCPVLIKSTVLPSIFDKLHANVSHSPEFLRQAHAYDDFEYARHMIISDNGFDFWKDIFLYRANDLAGEPLTFLKTDRKTAAMVKYMYNTWLAMKVLYFHEINALKKGWYDHNEMTEILGKMINIGPSHMKPHSDGSIGFDGACFPKDMQTFAEWTNSEVLQEILRINNSFR